jgi:hypothetical protein
VASALRAGYEPAGPCPDEPGARATGFHFANEQLTADPAARPTEPEAKVGVTELALDHVQ